MKRFGKSSIRNIGREAMLLTFVLLAFCLGPASQTLAKEAEKKTSPKLTAKKLPKKKRTEAPSHVDDELPTGSLSLYVASAKLPEPDALYQRYFAGLDQTIERQYHDRWRYHESQVPYALTRWGGEHLAIGSLNYYGKAPYEGDVRRQFAEVVFRQRVDAGIRAYFAAPERAAIRKVAATAKAMTEIRDVQMKLSEDGSSGELKFGINVLDDTAKLEYTHSRVFAGFYHGRFLNSLSRPDEFLYRLSLRVSTTLIPELSSAYAAYAVSGASFELGCDRQLSSQVSARFVTTQPRNHSPEPATYQFLVSYSF